MFFQTFNHDYIDIDTELHDCIICFEEDAHTGQLNSFSNKACLCNSWIHMSCLEKWYMTNSSCPICRQDLHVSYPIIIKQNDPPYWVLYYFLQYAERICIVIYVYIVISFIINIITYLQKQD